MVNVRLDIEYDGTDYHGWQRQRGCPTIQAHIEDNLAAILGRKVVVYGASRTDSGVHALGQVANFYAEDKWKAEQWQAILNFRLPKTIRIVRAIQMPDRWHAQKYAQSKLYEYRILNRAYASALDRRVFYYPRNIDWKAVSAALKHFPGEHDFRSFQGAKAEVRSTVRRLFRFDLEEEYPGLHRFRVHGNGFLKQMIRTMIGTLLEIGEGKRHPDSISEILAALDRNAAGRTLPASGLCLVRVIYPEGETSG